MSQAHGLFDIGLANNSCFEFLGRKFEVFVQPPGESRVYVYNPISIEMKFVIVTSPFHRDLEFTCCISSNCFHSFDSTDEVKLGNYEEALEKAGWFQMADFSHPSYTT